MKVAAPHDTRSIAREDLFAFEIAAIGQHRQFFRIHGLTSVSAHRCQLSSVVPNVRDLMSHDHVMFRIYRGLHVIAHHTRDLWPPWIQIRKIASDAFLELLQSGLQLAIRKVLIQVVHRLVWR